MCLLSWVLWMMLLLPCVHRCCRVCTVLAWTCLFSSLGCALHVWVELLVFWEFLTFGGTVEPYPKATEPSHFFSQHLQDPLSQRKLILTQWWEVMTGKASSANLWNLFCWLQMESSLWWRTQKCSFYLRVNICLCFKFISRKRYFFLLFLAFYPCVCSFEFLPSWLLRVPPPL